MEFLPLAEETGVILPMGQWVLEEACRQATTWQTMLRGGPPLTVSVNLSARQFQQPDLLQHVEQALAAAGLDPSWLRLELIESVLLDDPGGTLTKLEALSSLGVWVTIDDFGSGHESLTSLRRMPVRSLKLNPSFLGQLDSTSVQVVRAVALLAHTLGLEVSAEGIETDEQLARLREAELDRGQGFLLSRPLTADAIYRLLQQGLPLIA